MNWLPLAKGITSDSLGFVRPASVVYGHARLTTLSQRNHSVAAEQAGQPPLLHKLVLHARSVESQEREAMIYELFETVEPAFQVHVPKFYGWERDRSLLTIEFLPGAVTVDVLLHSQGIFPLEIARMLGEALALLHRDSTLATIATTQIGEQGGVLPWALDISQPTIELVRASSGAIRRILEIVQRHDEFAPALRNLREGWKRQSLIHNDLRWDNMIVQVQDHSNQIEKFMLVDWELAGVGDPRWDVGTVLAAFVGLWASSAPIGRGTPPDQLLTRSRHPIEALQPAILAFWTTYCQWTEGSHAYSESEIEMICSYAGAKLIQIAVERSQFSHLPPADAIILLQLGLNVLARPLDAAWQLFGLPKSVERERTDRWS